MGILCNQPDALLASSPPFRGPSCDIIVSQPAFLAEIAPKLLHAVADPFSFADVGRKPSSVMKDAREQKQWNHCGELVQDEERANVRNRSIAQRKREALEKPRHWKAP